jgi:hypothetical protein
MRQYAGIAVALVLGSLLVRTALTADPDPAKEKPQKGGYVHVVIFKMKKDAPANAVSNAIADCHKMLAGIPAVRSVRAGRPAQKGTPELAKKNYDFALLVLVDDEDGLKDYLEHPTHLSYVEKHGKSFDMTELKVFDFVNEKK